MNGVFGAASDLAYRAGIMPAPDHDNWFVPPDSETARELVAFTRRLRSEATPQILAQHMLITKHWPTNQIPWASEIALKNFVSALISFDDLVAAEEAKRKAAETPLPRRVPIEDTTLELTDGPLDTW